MTVPDNEVTHALHYSLVLQLHARPEPPEPGIVVQLATRTPTYGWSNAIRKSMRYHIVRDVALATADNDAREVAAKWRCGQLMFGRIVLSDDPPTDNPARTLCPRCETTTSTARVDDAVETIVAACEWGALF